ncbi:MAG: insulinase family protein [Fimbriimonadaceae bacterium]|nr:insulinase family protein [Fimbriimonadaceae bacterium]
MSIHKFTLPNGVRVLVAPNSNVRSAAIGITCRAGSRHETDQEGGITHFIEHMLFKGTKSRNAKQIAEEIEGRGGMLNAFTDKEQTTYYCRVLSDDAPIAVDVLSDMLVNSLLDPEELDRERGVILEEIKRSEDDPEDQVHELHMERRWGDHPLGRPIIGTRESVGGFQSNDLRSYIQRRYLGGNIVISAAGNLDPDAFLVLAKSKLAELPAGEDNPTLAPPAVKVDSKEIRKDVEQVHFCIGGDSVSVYSPDIYPIAVLDAVLGGGMSGRLFQEIRERRGLAYSCSSYNLSYSAAGMFTVYGGTGRQTWEQVQEVVASEIKRLIRDGLMEGELEKVKRQMAGNMVLGLESMNSQMMRMTKNELVHGREVPIDETLEKINAVTESQVRDVVAQIFADGRVSTTAIGPF